MERRKYTREFKLEAVRLIKDRGVSYAQASQDLNVHPTQLRNWVNAFADDPQQAFPGQGQVKPEQLEIARLKREVIKLKAERDILKKAAALLQLAGTARSHHQESLVDRRLHTPLARCCRSILTVLCGPYAAPSQSFAGRMCILGWFFLSVGLFVATHYYLFFVAASKFEWLVCCFAGPFDGRAVAAQD
jgi:transposase